MILSTHVFSYLFILFTLFLYFYLLLDCKNLSAGKNRLIKISDLFPFLDEATDGVNGEKI